MLREVPGVAVAATKRFIFLTLLGLSHASFSGVLPEQRLDLLYHSYEGGGVTIDGPSVLVRKNVSDKFSFYANHYVDMVTSASIDVLTMGSKYTEERTEQSFGADYLRDRTIMSLSYTNSTESDYIANTVGFSISQEFFGDLSTITMGYSQGDDTVKKRGSPDFEEDAKRKRYNVSFSQVMSKNWITSLTYETVLDEGFLRNPYRFVRELDTSSTSGFDFDREENYPSTRNSEALAIRGIYSLSQTASVRGEYRRFSDSWGIKANNIEFRFALQYRPEILLEARYRAYKQTKGADFYRDIFDFNSTAPEFYARDKELSAFSSNQFGLGLSYKFKSRYSFFNDSTLNLHWDTMNFDYPNFSDASSGMSLGNEPKYSLKAEVIRFFFSSYF